jgi:hypothetical protein
LDQSYSKPNSLIKELFSNYKRDNKTLNYGRTILEKFESLFSMLDNSRQNVTSKRTQTNEKLHKTNSIEFLKGLKKLLGGSYIDYLSEKINGRCFHIVIEILRALVHSAKSYRPTESAQSTEVEVWSTDTEVNKKVAERTMAVTALAQLSDRNSWGKASSLSPQRSAYAVRSHSYVTPPRSGTASQEPNTQDSWAVDEEREAIQTAVMTFLEESKKSGSMYNYMKIYDLADEYWQSALYNPATPTVEKIQLLLAHLNRLAQKKQLIKAVKDLTKMSSSSFDGSKGGKKLKTRRIIKKQKNNKTKKTKRNKTIKKHRKNKNKTNKNKYYI